MNPAIADLRTLLASMAPVLNGRTVAFVSVTKGRDWAASVPSESLIGTFLESEGTTLIVDAAAAERAGLPILFRAAWITLTVHSALHAVGLTAAFSGALAAAGIASNVVAAAHHDHVFVPPEQAAQAMQVLRRLARSGGH